MARLAYTFTLALALAAAACGGDDGGGGADAGVELENEGFATPTEITQAYMGADGNWTLVGPANWDCLDTPSTDEPLSIDVTLSGTIEDFQSGDPLPGATLTAFNDTNLAGAGVGTATSDEDGNFSVVLPTGSERVAFKVEHEDALPTFTLNQLYEPDTATQTDTINSVSVGTANTLPAFIGVMRTPGLGILAGSVVDCDGNEVGGAIATVSSTSGSVNHLEGAETYYFSAQSTSLPVRHGQQQVTNTDSLFVVIELPVAETAFLQVWGFVEGQDPMTDDLTLLAEIPSPVLADSVITASLDPLRQ